MKNLLFEALYDDNWIGGLYYVRNVVYSITQNDYLMQNYHIIIHTFVGNEEAFEDLNVHKIIYSKKRGNLLNNIKGRVVRISLNNPVSYPWTDRKTIFTEKNKISWIPDLQHKYYPEYFSEDMMRIRDEKYNSYIKDRSPIVFSSYSSLNDFKKFYNADDSKLYVLHFVSYIEPIISSITVDEEIQILRKYKLHNVKYACVMNQFWQHKNHKVVFDAMEQLFNKDPHIDLSIVFTGKLDDYRNPNYIKSIKEKLKDDNVNKHTRLLGFISRKEQIVIMKHALFVIQPSLFEGWGTVVEDAKVLDKTIILSDIPVHREQMNDKCILFNPTDENQLEEIIYKEFKNTHFDNISSGIKGMHVSAVKYSISFENLIKDFES